MKAQAPLTVALGSRSYPIHIGPGLLGSAAVFEPHVHGRLAAVVTNDVVAPLHADRLEAALAEAGARVLRIVLPDGEQNKNLVTLEQIYTALLETRADRRTVIVALGGGVVGDMAGFAASSYQRGIDFIQAPTTLLAQVDSSVGGKTGINHPLGKNMIGAFHQPLAVVADTDTLSTLPTREFASGLAEVVKHGAIRDAAELGRIEADAGALLAREPAALARAIRRACEIKADVVALDERESGVRALLNFGHTFGHAIEAAAGYGTWLHGEAVAAGMVLAARLSADLGMLPAADAARLGVLLGRLQLPVRPPAITPTRWLELMGRDKKNRDGAIAFVLLEALGRARLVRDVPAAALARVLEG